MINGLKHNNMTLELSFTVSKFSKIDIYSCINLFYAFIHFMQKVNPML